MTKNDNRMPRRVAIIAATLAIGGSLAWASAAAAYGDQGPTPGVNDSSSNAVGLVETTPVPGSDITLDGGPLAVAPPGAEGSVPRLEGGDNQGRTESTETTLAPGRDAALDGGPLPVATPQAH